MIYVHQEYKVKIKMVQEQQLPLKIHENCFLVGRIDQWCGESNGGNFSWWGGKSNFLVGRGTFPHPHH